MVVQIELRLTDTVGKLSFSTFSSKSPGSSSYNVIQLLVVKLYTSAQPPVSHNPSLLESEGQLTAMSIAAVPWVFMPRVVTCCVQPLLLYKVQLWGAHRDDVVQLFHSYH